MDNSELLEIIKSINVWKRGDKQAPHKPLLILLAISYLQNNDQRLLPYVEVDIKLKELLKSFGPPCHASRFFGPI